MKRCAVSRCVLLVTILAQSGLLLVPSVAGQASRPRKIAVFGSSVAFGTGDETNKEGYTGLLREMLAPRGWEVFNQSRPGDTTRGAATRFTPSGTPSANVRYLTTVNPSYVVIGLALTNEGILEAQTTAEKEAVFKQYADGLRSLVDRARQNNIVPIVGLVYPRMSYTPVEYEYARRMNLLLNSWDVPSVNLMGALDDGTGRYVIGFDSDDRHPNAAGHRELFHAFVPSLFEALEKGKPLPSRPAADRGFARVGGGTPITFDPPEAMHSFAFGFSIRTQGDGPVATISGVTLSSASETRRGGRGAGYESMTLSPAANFTALVAVENGKLTYRSAGGTPILAPVAGDAQWHQVLLSHYTARGETLFFIDGKLAGRTAERLQPRHFALGGPRQGDYKDLLIYRSALNAEEVAALASGTLLQASMEIYSPLADETFNSIENRAQSLSSVKVSLGQVTHLAR